MPDFIDWPERWENAELSWLKERCQEAELDDLEIVEALTMPWKDLDTIIKTKITEAYAQR